MVHLAPPIIQEEANALNNEVALDRAWFSLDHGALAQADALKRFENLYDAHSKLVETHAQCEETVGKLVAARIDLQHNANLYSGLLERFRKLKEEHAGSANQLQAVQREKDELSRINNDQSLRIKELEDKLAKKDSALVYADHEYKQSFFEPFNLAIQVGWAKGLAQGRTEEEIMNALSRVEGFDAYSDKKMYVQYDKLFEKRYPYVEKVASGFRHLVADLLKIHPDPPPPKHTVVVATSKAPTGFGVRSSPKKKT
ncbi:hypothetical protein Tco_0617867 [Tanacetum coccineum]